VAVVVLVLLVEVVVDVCSSSPLPSRVDGAPITCAALLHDTSHVADIGAAGAAQLPFTVHSHQGELLVWEVLGGGPAASLRAFALRILGFPKVCMPRGW
jgi:hypothetical protein